MLKFFLILSLLIRTSSVGASAFRLRRHQLLLLDLRRPTTMARTRPDSHGICRTLHSDDAAEMRDDDEWAVQRKNLEICVYRILMRQRERGRAELITHEMPRRSSFFSIMTGVQLLQEGWCIAALGRGGAGNSFSCQSRTKLENGKPGECAI